MKIVYASTPDQEILIKELVSVFYQEIFPMYFSDKDIDDFKRQHVLHTTTRHFEYFGTLKEAFQVITSLQTLISILQSQDDHGNHEPLFQKNVQILEEFGLYFPFRYQQFHEAKSMKNEMFSVYTKPANELLV